LEKTMDRRVQPDVPNDPRCRVTAVCAPRFLLLSDG
jgi:hypothetical protein